MKKIVRFESKKVRAYRNLRVSPGHGVNDDGSVTKITTSYQKIIMVGEHLNFVLMGIIGIFLLRVLLEQGFAWYAFRTMVQFLSWGIIDDLPH